MLRPATALPLTGPSRWLDLEMLKADERRRAGLRCPLHLPGAGCPSGAPGVVPRPGGARPDRGRLEGVKHFPSSSWSPLNATTFL